MSNSKKTPLKDVLKGKEGIVGRGSGPPPLPKKIIPPEGSVSAQKKSGPPPLPKKIIPPEGPVFAQKKSGPPPLPLSARETSKSLDIDISVEVPKESSPSLSKIRDNSIELNLLTLFDELIREDTSLKAVFRDLTPRIDKDRNIIVSGKTVGKFIGDSARIYFHKVWKGNVYDKVRLFTENNLFLHSSKENCIFFTVERKIISIAYSKTEEGKEGPFRMSPKFDSQTISS